MSDSPDRARPCIVLALAGLNLLALSPYSSFAEDKTTSETVLLYRTPEERRDAGFQHQVLPWLNLASLAEFEYATSIYSLAKQQGRSTIKERGATGQVSAELKPLDRLTSEVVYEYEFENGQGTLQEATATFELGRFSLELGKSDLDFGEYYSFFSTGPVLEFGETREQMAELAFDLDDLGTFNIFVYPGRARQTNSASNKLDGGLALECAEWSWGTCGVSFISDLADSLQGFLEDTHYRHRHRVPALSWNIVARSQPYEATLEYVGALSSFDELEEKRDRPRALNLEVARAFEPDILTALRAEWSTEVEDAPHYRSGISFSWRTHERFVATLDILRAWYQAGMAQTADDQRPDSAYVANFKVSIGF